MDGVTHFANPSFLWLLLLLLPMIGYYIYRTMQGGAAIQMSTIDGLVEQKRTAKYYLRHLPIVLRCSAVALLIVALARPQNSEHKTSTTTEGIDIMLAIDVSGSMLARDFTPDRIAAAREVASQFIVDRTNDRIGIVMFAGESFTQSPLTADKPTLLNLMSQVRTGIIEDGTAIGNGLATAINRLKDSKAESRVVILLTDGENNRGEIAPLTAADIAATLGIKVYTIGVGTRGMAPYPMIDAWGRVNYIPQKVHIDEELLREMAAQTGGEYFRAVDSESLREVYNRIDELEKSKIDTSDYTIYNELFTKFALWALVLLIVEFFVRHVWLRRIP